MSPRKNSTPCPCAFGFVDSQRLDTPVLARFDLSGLGSLALQTPPASHSPVPMHMGLMRSLSRRLSLLSRATGLRLGMGVPLQTALWPLTATGPPSSSVGHGAENTFLKGVLGGGGAA